MVIYISSDLPILCITRAQIVIGLRASEVQSFGIASARLGRDILFSPHPPNENPRRSVFPQQYRSLKRLFLFDVIQLRNFSNLSSKRIRRDFDVISLTVTSSRVNDAIDRSIDRDVLETR